MEISAINFPTIERLKMRTNMCKRGALEKESRNINSRGIKVSGDGLKKEGVGRK